MKPETRPITPLPPLDASRWKWMSGSTAAIGATAAALSTEAGTVQISQVGNFFGFEQAPLSNIDPDLTGDGIPDLTSAYGKASLRNYYSYIISTAFTTTFRSIYLSLNSSRVGSVAFSIYYVDGIFNSQGYKAALYVSSSPNNKGGTRQTSTAFMPVTFRDLRINAGAPMNGFLELRATSNSVTDHRIELLRLVFDDASTVAPAGVAAGAGAFPEWIDPGPVRKKIKKLQKKIKKETAKLKKALKARDRAKAAKFKRKIKKLKILLKRLRKQL